MNVGDKVMPKKVPVTSKGCIWEHLLDIAGWNSLPQSQKPLTVTSVVNGIPAVNHPLWGDEEMVVFENEVVPA